MANFLRTCTPEGDWRSLRFTNPDSVVWLDGQLYMLVATVGVVIVAQALTAQGCADDLDVDPDAEGVMIYHAEKIMLPKAFGSGGTIWLVGQKAYWSGVGGDPVTNVYQSGFYWIAVCVAPAGIDDERVKCDLKGDKASLTEPL
jgi:hypothetical protein